MNAEAGGGLFGQEFSDVVFGMVLEELNDGVALVVGEVIEDAAFVAMGAEIEGDFVEVVAAAKLEFWRRREFWLGFVLGFARIWIGCWLALARMRFALARIRIGCDRIVFGAKFFVRSGWLG